MRWVGVGTHLVNHVAQKLPNCNQRQVLTLTLVVRHHDTCCAHGLRVCFEYSEDSQRPHTIRLVAPHAVRRVLQNHKLVHVPPEQRQVLVVSRTSLLPCCVKPRRRRHPQRTYREPLLMPVHAVLNHPFLVDVLDHSLCVCVYVYKCVCLTLDHNRTKANVPARMPAPPPSTPRARTAPRAWPEARPVQAEHTADLWKRVCATHLLADDAYLRGRK